MKALYKADSIVNTIARILNLLSYLACAVMILLTVADVILRAITGNPILGAYEITQYTLLTFIFASFAYTQTEHGHIQVTMFLRILPRKVMFAIYAVMEVLSTVFWVYFAYAAYLQAVYAFDKGYFAQVLKFPTYPFYALVCVCLIIFALTTLMSAIKTFAAMFNKEFGDELFEKWF